MGLFDKKYCDICGEKIAFLGAKKLSDGQICKNCEKKLSPWFSERKQSSVDDIRLQLGYRKNNEARVEAFNISESYGEYGQLLIDSGMQAIIVDTGSNWRKDNPDVVDFKDITGCKYSVSDSTTELKRKGADGKDESYDPACYKHSYCFTIEIFVNNEFFDEMHFRLNPSSSVEISDQPLIGDRVKADPEKSADYKKYRAMAEDVVAKVLALRDSVK